MYNLIYSKLPIPFKIAAIIMIIPALYSIFMADSILIGLLILLFSSTVLTLKNGIKFDFLERKYLKYFKVFGFSSGNWEELNDLKYISIVPVILKQRYNVLSIGMETQDKQCKINFIYRNNKYDSIIRNKYAKILPIAKDLANGFNVDILDISNGKKEWLVDYEVL